MRHGGPDKGFWQGWHEMHRHAGGPLRRLWQEHLCQFLGESPEDHWFFGGRRLMQWACGPGGPLKTNPFVKLIFSKGGGILPLYVLHLLVEQPRYGNDVMREIEKRTGGRWGSNPGAIYPLLAFLEAQGLVEGAWEAPRKRTRRFYHITERGREELRSLKEVVRPGVEDALHILRGVYEELYSDAPEGG